jgi:hypothetical protein
MKVQLVIRLRLTDSIMFTGNENTAEWAECAGVTAKPLGTLSSRRALRNFVNSVALR